MNAKRSLAAVCVVVCLVAGVSAAGRQLVRKPKYDPTLPSLDLFEAIDQGKIETSVVAKSPHEATLYITNTTDDAVQVQMPKAVVAVHVLKQILGQGPGRGGGPPGQNGGGPGGMAQSIGGGMQNMGNNQFGMNNGGGNNLFNNGGNGFGNIPGNGIFSVPPEKTVQIGLRTVCLSHGRPNPRPKLTYQLVRLEDYTNDGVLQEALKLFAEGGIDLPTAQAAAWHLTDKLSWETLRAKQIEQWGGLDPVPFFSEDELARAENLVQQARRRAKEQPPVDARREQSRRERTETAAR